MDRDNPSNRSCYICGDAPDKPWPAPSLCAEHMDTPPKPSAPKPVLRRQYKPVQDSKSAKDVALTDQERIWLAGLLTEHLEKIAKEHPNTPCEVAECTRDLAWGKALHRRLWQGVEL